MNSKSVHTYLLLIFCLSLTACNNCGTIFWKGCDQDCKGQFDEQIEASFENDPAGSPLLTVTDNSPAINIESAPVVTESNGRIQINYPAVTIKNGKDVYELEDICTERRLNEEWIIDDENFLSYDFSKSLDIVLVLDVSSSLADNLERIKENASNIVERILSENPNANISVVKFSRGFVTLPFSTAEATIQQFIEDDTQYNSPDIGIYTLEGRNETGLYEAMNEAITLLSSSSAKGKGVLTFTDGVSNFQFDPQYQNSTLLLQKLQGSDIASYTIGYDGNQGGVEQNALEQLAVNGDSSFPNNLNQLEEVFERFSNSIAAVYDLIYDTNNAKFDGSIDYRFFFKTNLISE